VARVGADGDEGHLVVIGPEEILRSAQLIGDQRTRVGTVRVEERQGDGFSAQLGERKLLAGVVRERELGRRDPTEIGSHQATRLAEVQQSG
jgi:hypothetical protein